MFRPLWLDLSTDAKLPQVEASLPADKLNSRMLKDLQPRILQLPFYRDGFLVAFSELERAPPNDRLFLWSPAVAGPAAALNWTNEPIYAFNESDGMELSFKALPDYVRFFFHFVRGGLGRFIIVESLEEIKWDAAVADAETKGHTMIREQSITIEPLRYKGLHEHAEAHVMTASVVFKNALFKTDIVIAPYEQDIFDPEEDGPEHFAIGQMKMTNENLLVEDLPIAIEGPPGEFEEI